MKEVNIENVQARIAQIENAASVMLPAGLGLSLKHEFELACLRALVGKMAIEDDMHNVINLLANNEWAEHCTTTVLGSMLEAEVTRLVGKAQSALQKYNIGEATMLHIFTATGMTDVSDMQAVFDQVEKALVKLERKPKVIEPDGWRDMMTRLANGLELMTSLASERAISVDTCVCLEWVRDARAMLDQEHPAPVVPDDLLATFTRKRLLEIIVTGPGASGAEQNALARIALALMPPEQQEPATDNTAQQFEALATSAQPEIIGYEQRLICGELRRVPKFAGPDIEATSEAPDPLEARRRRNRESNRRARAIETPEHAKQRRQRNRDRMRAARSGKK